MAPWSGPLDGLPLLYATPPAWSTLALANLDYLLVDHAHCEQKAAGAALGILARFPENSEMVRPMLALAHEELHHFRQVLELIEARGGTLTRPAPDFYVRELRLRLFRAPGGLGPYGDLLIVNAFVEARSCERFRQLAQALTEQGGTSAATLAPFYRTLAGAEGRHWETFRDLACARLDRTRVAARIEIAAAIEAEISRERPITPRMH